MEINEALNIISSKISQINGLPAGQIAMEDSLIKTLKLDSIELIEFLISLEEQGLFLQEEQINADLTVGDLVKLCC